jgi:hypothetical protein
MQLQVRSVRQACCTYVSCPTSCEIQLVFTGRTPTAPIEPSCCLLYYAGEVRAQGGLGARLIYAAAAEVAAPCRRGGIQCQLQEQPPSNSQLWLSPTVELLPCMRLSPQRQLAKQ